MCSSLLSLTSARTCFLLSLTSLLAPWLFLLFSHLSCHLFSALTSVVTCPRTCFLLSLLSPRLFFSSLSPLSPLSLPSPLNSLTSFLVTSATLPFAYISQCCPVLTNAPPRCRYVWMVEGEMPEEKRVPFPNRAAVDLSLLDKWVDNSEIPANKVLYLVSLPLSHCLCLNISASHMHIDSKPQPLALSRLAHMDRVWLSRQLCCHSLSFAVICCRPLTC